MDLRDLIHFLKFMFTVIPVIGTFAGLVLYLVNHYNRYQCDQYMKHTGRFTTYSEYDSCYVEINGSMERWEAYMERVKASELMKGDLAQ